VKVNMYKISYFLFLSFIKDGISDEMPNKKLFIKK
jgi:hypothetical protein